MIPKKLFRIESAFPPIGANKATVACWWSILHLILDHSPCHLWTLTTSTTLPHSYYGNMHSLLMKHIGHAVENGSLPHFGGVRVVEDHPGGHGLHYHWVIRGRVSVNVIRRLATKAGFGRIHVDPDPCTPWVAPYLAKYLTKQSRIAGIRSWSCIGDYDGIKTRDIEVQSRSIHVYRLAYRDALALGMSKGVAFAMAKKAQRAFDLYADDATMIDGNPVIGTDRFTRGKSLTLAELTATV